jgi:hypothetical protein
MVLPPVGGAKVIFAGTVTRTYWMKCTGVQFWSKLFAQLFFDVFFMVNVKLVVTFGGTPAGLIVAVKVRSLLEAA